jgi:hypothetical protein
MIKLTEIITEAGHYDAELERNSSSYSLRRTYINPNFIVFMVDNKKFNEMHGRNPVVKELTPAAKFTRMAMATSAGTLSYHNILGSPEQHFCTIKENQK